MESIDRQRINNNLGLLVNETSYERLIHTIDKLDVNRQILTEALVLKWKERIKLGWNSKQQCMAFYSDIQRRGPDAFQLLISCLKASDHSDLACALDPTLSIDEEPHDVPLEYYSDEGDHFVFINKEWKSEECLKDREAVENLFQNQGYQRYEEGKAKLEDVSSLVVVVFSLYLDGSQQMENHWLHSKFNDHDLHKKPKILISFLYSTPLGHYGGVQEETAKMTTRNYEDVLHIKIYVDAKKRGSSSVVSEEVQQFISVFSSDLSLHLEEKLRKLQQLYNEKGLHPITTLDSRFRKLYRVQKPS